MSVMVRVCRRLVLLVAVATLLVSSSGEEARARTNEVTILIDSSMSMKGDGCDSTCKPCTKQDDVCKAMGDAQGSYKCLRGKCQRRPTQKCEAIWDDVIQETKDYVDTLDEDTQLYLYTFGRGRKYSPQPLEGGAMTEERRRTVIRQLSKQKPQATCTCLYNNMWELMDEMDRRKADDHFQTLFAFTDGLNDCDGKTLDDLKKRAKINKERFRLIIKNTPDSGEGIYEPSFSLKSTVLSLDSKVVEGTVSLVEEKKTLFPFEVEVAWVPDAGVKELLSCTVSPALVPGGLDGAELPVGSFQCDLKPDFAKKRPKELSGKLVFKRGHGRIKLKRTEVPVSFDLKRWKTKEKLSLGKWCQAKDTLSIATPDALLNVLSAQHNHSKLTWKKPKLSWGKKTSKGLKKRAKVRVSNKAYHAASGSKIRLSLSVRKRAKTRRIEEGSLSFKLRDNNGWVEVDGVSAAIGIDTKACKKGSCGDGKCSPSERKSGKCEKDCPKPKESSMWPWLLLLLLFALGVVLWIKRKPNLEGLRLEHKEGLDARFQLFENGAMRVAPPVARPISLRKIADEEELVEPPPGFKVSESPTSEGDGAADVEAPLTQEQALAWLGAEKSTVSARYERPRVFLTAKAPIFRRVDEPEADFVSEIELGTMRARGFRPSGAFRVLNQGQVLTVTSDEGDS